MKSTSEIVHILFTLSAFANGFGYGHDAKCVKMCTLGTLDEREMAQGE